jgi:hydroxypyruvate reductase
MAEAAGDALAQLNHPLVSGIVVTKYGHSQGSLPNIDIYESGHPVSDENTIKATEKCIELAESLNAGDELLFLISGGGSALFEAPLPGVTLADIQDVTNQLLASAADIVEINMIRKRLSRVKAGRFAKLAAPAKVFSIVLSDVLGDRLDSIASGPAYPDSSTAADAIRVAEKYNLKLKHQLQETPKEGELDNVKTVITGSVRSLCDSAAKAAQNLGYAPTILTTSLNCEAKEAGDMLAAKAKEMQGKHISCAIIAGGETVVTLKGKGKGGRNQELALSAAKGIAGMSNTLIFSLGSDGTDGPTDAAGGIVDGESLGKLKQAGYEIDEVLDNNDSYHALKAINSLIITGPTGTNVNDVAVLLVR